MAAVRVLPDGRGDPLRAKSAQRVPYRPWPGLTASGGVLKSLEIRARWCQSRVSAGWRPVRFREHLIRSDLHAHSLPAYFTADLLRGYSLVRTLSVIVRPKKRPTRSDYLDANDWHARRLAKPRRTPTSATEEGATKGPTTSRKLPRTRTRLIQQQTRPKRQTARRGEPCESAYGWGQCGSQRQLAAGVGAGPANPAGMPKDALPHGLHPRPVPRPHDGRTTTAHHTARSYGHCASLAHVIPGKVQAGSDLADLRHADVSR